MSLRKMVRKKLRSICFTIFNRLENNNNADFHSNGEQRFLSDFFSTFRKDVILFDIGANVGEYSEILIEECKKFNINYFLHVFEPTKSCYEILEKKFNCNKNVFLNNVGVSEFQATTKIYYDVENSGFASLYKRDLDFLNVNIVKEETISLICLEEYFSARKIPRIDFLKLDIEGHELFALKGMGKFLNADFIKAIQFEYGGANIDSRTFLLDLFRLLESKGFKVGKVLNNRIEFRNYNSWMENFQYANYIAVNNKKS